MMKSIIKKTDIKKTKKIKINIRKNKYLKYYINKNELKLYLSQYNNNIDNNLLNRKTIIKLLKENKD